MQMGQRRISDTGMKQLLPMDGSIDSEDEIPEPLLLHLEFWSLFA